LLVIDVSRQGLDSVKDLGGVAVLGRCRGACLQVEVGGVVGRDLVRGDRRAEHHREDGLAGALGGVRARQRLVELRGEIHAAGIRVVGMRGVGVDGADLDVSYDAGGVAFVLLARGLRAGIARRAHAIHPPRGRRAFLVDALFLARTRRAAGVELVLQLLALQRRRERPDVQLLPDGRADMFLAFGGLGAPRFVLRALRLKLINLAGELLDVARELRARSRDVLPMGGDLLDVPHDAGQRVRGAAEALGLTERQRARADLGDEGLNARRRRGF
jgi:hypothetical protein